MDRKGGIFLFIIIVIVVLPMIFLHRQADTFLTSALSWLHDNRVIGIAIFIPFEIIWIVLCLPTTPLELGCGFIYGFYGIIINTAGKFIGCVVAFSLGRSCLRSSVKHNFSQSQVLRDVDFALSHDSWSSTRLLILIQLSYVPIALKCYGVSLTNVSLYAFAWTSLVGELLGTCALVLAGASARDITKVIRGEEPMTPLEVVALAVSIISSVIIGFLIIFFIPQAMKNMERHSLSHSPEKQSEPSEKNTLGSCLEDLERATEMTEVHETAGKDHVYCEVPRELLDVDSITLSSQETEWTPINIDQSE